MAEQTTAEGLTVEQIENAQEVLSVVAAKHRTEGRVGFGDKLKESEYLVEQYENTAQWSPDHKLDVGDYAIDDYEPTPSPEINTVEVVRLINQRADEFVVEDTGKTVAEHENNQFYPDDDLVVAGVYPNMDDDRVWHFPESRLR